MRISDGSSDVCSSDLPLSVETPSPYQATSAYLSHGCAATLGSPTITRAASTTSALRIGASLSIGAAEPRIASGVGHVRARHPVELLAGLVAERDPLIVHDAPVVRIGHFIGHAHLFRAIELPWRKLDRDGDVHAGVAPVGPLGLQLCVGAVVEVAVRREHVRQALVRDEAVAEEVPAVVALDAAVAGLALGAGLGGTAVQAAEDFAQVGLGADRAAFAVVDPGDGVLADVGGGGGDAIGAAVVVRLVVLAQRGGDARSEEHTSELQSLMRISYAVFCLKKKNKPT